MTNQLLTIISGIIPALQTTIDDIGSFMYVVAMIALLVIGGIILVLAYMKYWRYYKKGLLSISSFLPILGLGLLLFVLGIIMLVTW